MIKDVLTEHMSRTVMMRQNSRNSSEIGGVKITVTPWGEGPRKYMIPLDIYADAMAELSEAKGTNHKIWMSEDTRS